MDPMNAAGADAGYDEPHAGRAHLDAVAAQWKVPPAQAAITVGRMFTTAWKHLIVAFRPIAEHVLAEAGEAAQALRELHDTAPIRFHGQFQLDPRTCPFCPDDALADEHRLLRELQIAEAAQLLGIHDLAGLIRTVIANQEEQMHDITDLRRAVAANGAADEAIITAVTSLREQIRNIPTDRPLNAEEQAALDEAVDALTEHTTRLVQATTDTNAPATNGGGGTQGSVVTIPAAQTTNPDGPQGGVVNLDDEHPTPTGGTQGTATIDPGSSTATSTADAPPAGTAADVAAAETKDADAGDPVTEDGTLTTVPPGDAVVSNPGASVLQGQEGTGDEATVGDGPSVDAVKPNSGVDPAAVAAEEEAKDGDAAVTEPAPDTTLTESPSTGNGEGFEGESFGGSDRFNGRY